MLSKPPADSVLKTPSQSTIKFNFQGFRREKQMVSPFDHTKCYSVILLCGINVKSRVVCGVINVTRKNGKTGVVWSKMVTNIIQWERELGNLCVCVHACV